MSTELALSPMSCQSYSIKYLASFVIALRNACCLRLAFAGAVFVYGSSWEFWVEPVEDGAGWFKSRNAVWDDVEFGSGWLPRWKGLIHRIVFAPWLTVAAYVLYSFLVAILLLAKLCGLVAEYQLSRVALVPVCARSLCRFSGLRRHFW